MVRLGVAAETILGIFVRSIHFANGAVSPFKLGRWASIFALAAAIAISGGVSWTAESRAATVSEVEKLFRQGQYEAAEAAAAREVERGVWNERWSHLLLRCQLTRGRYGAALGIYEAAQKRYANSIQLRRLGRDVYQYNGLAAKADAEYRKIYSQAKDAPWRYTTAEDLVTLGEYFYTRGEDAKRVLELFYDRARKSDPNSAAPYIATAELALDKHDHKLAADSLAEAQKRNPDDPHVAYLAARAWADSDAERATKELTRALKLNPRHVPSLLWQADRLVDAEDYDEAKALLSRVLQVNVYTPEVWSYFAVIAHVGGDYEGEGLLRKAALCRHKLNPEVDHLIGGKLSQKYRFAEGAEYQKRALRMDPAHPAARFQLAQDLLRLGDEDEGWKLARQAYADDGYNVVAHNLVTLHDRLQKFASLRGDGVLVRMDAREARIYGPQVLELLSEARKTLAKKYDVELPDPVVIEIFPQQKDFAIRTFGLPGGAGFLGVCFGRVITMNSPASQGATPSNWQAVLWHEFCHVVTLTKTRNKMPRWLSEGISVYEERLRNPSWGQGMTAQYREMTLGDDLTPVSRLSGAFLSPKSPVHLQFAYYESSLVVEYLVDKYGPEMLQRVLVDLGVGMPINESLQRYVGSLAALDQEFAEFARQRARGLAPDADFDREDLPQRGTAAQWQEIVDEKPNNYWALKQLAVALVRDGKWKAARATADRLVKLYPDDTSGGSGWQLLAQLHRRDRKVGEERQALEKVAQLKSDAVDVYTRLIELAIAEGDWEAVAQNAERLWAVNPLLPISSDMLAKAGEQLGRYEDVVRGLAAQAEMDPVDPALLHFRLAQAWLQLDKPSRARREVLKALEEAPRYRDAQRLLLKLVAQQPAGGKKSGTLEPDKPDTDKPDTDKPDTDKPDTDKPDKPDTDKPDTDKPDTDKPKDSPPAVEGVGR